MLEMAGRRKCQCEQNLKKAMGIKDKKGRSSEKNLAEDYADYLCKFIIKKQAEKKIRLKA